MTYEIERERILSTCTLMQKMGYFIGTWGNISMRCKEGILLTPSRISYEEMTPEDLVLLDLQGNIAEGFRVPSSEKEVHRQIYLCRPDVNAIIHAHTACAMAVSAIQTEQIPCLVEEMSQLLGGAIPLTRSYIPAKEHQRLGLEAARYIGDRNGIILKNHGPVACGRTMEEAILVSRVIEKACRIYMSVLGKEGVAEIPEPLVKSERQRYLYHYGNEKT